jgi:hypothetical protein
MEAQSKRSHGKSTTDVLDKVFFDHPRSLGETYWQHQRRALRFGTSMITAGVACLVHALIPAVFVRTASTMVLRLHDEMHAAKRLRENPHIRSSPLDPALGRSNSF